MKPANKAKELAAEASAGANAAELVERRAGAKGNAHQQSTHWTRRQARVTQALERIRQSICRHTPEVGAVCGKSRTYGSGGGGRAMKRMSLPLQRREFITLLGGAAAAWPLAARAQQPAIPVIGLLDPRSPDATPDRIRGFREGLRGSGFVEGENVAIDYRFADGQFERLPELAAQLVRRQVAVIAVTNTASALAVKAATATIPIVFAVPEDPVGLGLVASVARPGGNATGINFFSQEVVQKRLEAPARAGARRHAGGGARQSGRRRDDRNHTEGGGRSCSLPQTANPRSSTPAPAGRSMQRSQFLCVSVPTPSSSVAFGKVAHRECSGNRSSSARRYSSNILDAYRQVGVYAGRILNGAKPADLPVVQSAKFELVINHQTARMLGLTVPPTLLARADEVIE